MVSTAELTKAARGWIAGTDSISFFDGAVSCRASRLMIIPPWSLPWRAARSQDIFGIIGASTIFTHHKTFPDLFGKKVWVCSFTSYFGNLRLVWAVQGRAKRLLKRRAAFILQKLKLESNSSK